VWPKMSSKRESMERDDRPKRKATKARPNATKTKTEGSEDSGDFETFGKFDFVLF